MNISYFHFILLNLKIFGEIVTTYSKLEKIWSYSYLNYNNNTRIYYLQSISSSNDENNKKTGEGWNLPVL